MKKILAGLLLLSQIAMAQNYVIDPASNDLKLDANSVGDDFTAEQKIAIPVSTIQYYYDVETRTCSKIECDEVDNNGNPTWSGYFTTNNANEKATILSNLIKGIGKSTAEKIVTYKLLQNRPKTWSKFVNAINYVQKELEERGYKQNFSKNVVELYAYENAIALGYYTTTSCHQVNYTCEILVEKEKKVFAYNLYKNLVVNYKGKGSNAHLYPFETETITMVTEGNGETKLSSSTSYNDYTSSVSILDNASTVSVTIQATKRNAVTLPANVLSVKTQFNNQNALLEVQVNSPYISILNNKNAMTVNYQVCAKKKLSWGKSSCKEPVASGSEKLTSANLPISIPVSITSGAKYYIVYSVVMTNSADFKTGVITDGASETYKAP